MAVMADFARMPTSRKVLLFVAIGGALGAIYYQFAYKSLVADLDNVEAEQAQKVALNAKKDAELDDFKKLKVRLPELNRIISENQKALPSEAEVSAFFETINRKINEAGATFVRSQQENEQTVEKFVKVPVTFEMTGSFLQIKRFFASLQPKKPSDRGDATTANDQSVEERERIVSIDNLSLGEPQVKSGQIVLTARFTAATFRQEEPKDVPGPKASGGVAPAPPAKSATAPAAPLPPAATPAGAKARSDAAMDKDQKRTDSKVGSDRLKGGL